MTQQAKETGEVIIYTDGACSGNPGPGGWGVILIYRRDGMKERRKELSGAEPATTNNRMEMMAAIAGLEALKPPDVLKRKMRVQLHTDSEYLKKGITEWIKSWKRNGWRTADKRPVKNADLWQRLDALIQRYSARSDEGYEVVWHWLRGHTGHTENERADELARTAILQLTAKSKGQGK
jgi:ribonuclease HI